MAITKLRGSLAILLLATLGGHALAAPAKRALSADDMFRMEAVSEPQISPDGQWIAYLVATSDRDADEFHSAIWMVSWDGKQQLQLTQPSSSVFAALESRTAATSRYLGKTGDAEHTQVMLLDRRGGEPRALTNVSDDIESYAWSPDSKRLVLVMETER